MSAADVIKDRAAKLLAKNTTGWTYAGWCTECFFRAVNPGHDLCAACCGWDDALDKALDDEHTAVVLAGLDVT